MVFPQDRLDVAAELFVAGKWQDITSDLRLAKGVTIKRGRENETSEVGPASCSFTLDNRSGSYSPRNPLSPYYSSLGRNTPFRCAVRIVNDPCGATVSNGWGTAPTGASTTTPWSTSGGVAGDYAKASGKATHTIGTANSTRLSYLAAQSYRNIDVSYTWTLPVTNITGGTVSSAVVLRGQSTSSFYQARVTVSTSEAISVDFCLADGLSITGSPVVVAGLTHSSAQALRIRAQVEGHTLRIKVWAEASGEPYNWSYTWTDEDMFGDTTTLVSSPGFVGVLSATGTGNTNVPLVFSYDNIEVRSPRFAGEVAAWPSRRDVSGADRYIDVEASGMTRRLMQGASPLDSAPRRFYTQPHVFSDRLVGYWPLEEGSLAVEGRPLIGPDYSPYRFIVFSSPLSTEKHFGQGTLAPWLSKSFVHNGSTVTTCDVDMSTSFVATDGWMVEHVRNGGRQIDSHLIMRAPGFGGQQWTVGFLGDTEQVRTTLPNGSTSTVSYPAAFDDGAHHVQFAAYQSGADIVWGVSVDGELVDGSIHVGATLAELRVILFSGDGVDTGTCAVGHLAVYNVTFGTSGNDGAAAAFGFTGETAGTRMWRLCGEEGIEFGWIGQFFSGANADETEPMGPQSVATLPVLLQECAVVDGGTLYEARGTNGLLYRTRASTFTQSAAVTINYATGQLSPPLEPVDDDQLTRNDVELSRRDGGSYRYELTTGPLSVLPPQDGGVGRYNTSASINADNDTQLIHQAQWAVHLGTVNEERFPVIAVDRSASAVSSDATLSARILDLDLDDRVIVSNAHVAGFYGGIEQLARGYTEYLDLFSHKFNINCTPASPYRVLTADDATYGRVDSGSSSLTSSLTSSATSFQVTSTQELWTTAVGDFPLDIVVGGEVIRISAISGASSPQTFTVATSGRSINGVVKSHSAGVSVQLAQPNYVGL